MFGQNPIRKKDHESPSLRVQEIFHTIQGEGPYAGVPAVFLRLAGCNLRCHFCFVGATKIRMADGSQKRIDAVCSGDRVLSYDEHSGMFKPGIVTKVMMSHTDDIVLVRTGASGNPTDKLYCTPDHLLLVRDRGWVAARDLLTGDNIIHLDLRTYKSLFNPMHSTVTKGKVKRFWASSRGQALKRAASDRMRDYMADYGAYATSQRMLNNNPMKDPAVALKSFLRRNDRGHKTRTEVLFEQITEGLPIEFIGDGKLTVAHKIPDFRVIGQRKLIEVWASDAPHAQGRDAAWEEARARRFSKYGYKTMFVPFKEGRLLDRAGIRQRVAEFINNGDTVADVTVIPKGSKSWVALTGGAHSEATVYNLSVDEHHTYIANGKVVHNCDTDFETGYEDVRTYEAVVKSIRSLASTTKTKLLVITGGEPLLQNFLPIIHALTDREGTGWHVQIETAGTLWLPGLQEYILEGRASLVCSPKTGKVHPLVTMHCQAWKYVIRDLPNGIDPKDGLPLASTQTANDDRTWIYRPIRRFGDRIYLQPCDEGPEATRRNTDLAAFLCMAHGYTLCLQLHKIVGLP